jgi:glycosyltransferase involved in cell wall biosynthesis
MQSSQRTVLVVEENAHWPIGHSPVRFAQLATAFADLGYRVEVLTAWGWVRADEHPDAPFTVHSYTGTAQFTRRVASWCRRTKTTTGRRLGDDLAALALAIGARSGARALRPRPDAVVMLGWNTDPVLVGAVLGHGHWLLYEFEGADQTRPAGGAAFSPAIERLARFRANQRRRSRSRFRVGAPSERRRAEWSERSSAIDPVTLPIAGVRRFMPVPHAREKLHLPVDTKVALLFGDVFKKRPDTVYAAFAELPDWTLVVGGPIANDVSDPHAGRCNLVAFPGNVDDATRDALFSAADLVVLSFEPGYENNSGTLMDAISAGVPVVCSEPSAAATVVQKFNLGAVFNAGADAELHTAVSDGSATVTATDLAVAREELSSRSVAARIVDAVRSSSGSPRV